MTPEPVLFECAECHGEGGGVRERPGGFHDFEPESYEAACEECDGQGSVEKVCDCGDGRGAVVRNDELGLYLCGVCAAEEGGEQTQREGA